MGPNCDECRRCGGCHCRDCRRGPPISAEQLGLLKALVGRPSYGLELQGRLAMESGIELGAGIYVWLRRMEADGLLRSYEGAPLAVRAGGSRRYYEVTEAGHAALGCSV